jgi:hypothetical protein
VVSFAETRLSEEEVGSGVRKKVFSILVEILENVARYSPGKEAEKTFGMPLAMLKWAGKIYSLTTGNLILTSDVKSLKSLLDEINRSNRDELTNLLKRSLSDQTLDSDSTGNMGLIEIARKSGAKLEYEFERINDSYSYYTITVQVDENLA